MKPFCDLCKTRHELYQGHVFASNAVSPVANTVANKPRDRVKAWRERNPALYLERQREYMRKMRKRKIGVVL